MRLISSRSMWVYKKAFPTIWFGFLAFCSLVLITQIFGDPSVVLALIILSGLAVLGYVIMQEYVFPMMDEVWIDEDDLVVRNRGEEDRFPIRNVVNVDHSWMHSPERIELLVNPRSRFGPMIQFIPTDRWWPFGRHPLTQELIDRSGCLARRRANASQ